MSKQSAVQLLRKSLNVQKKKKWLDSEDRSSNRPNVVNVPPAFTRFSSTVLRPSPLCKSPCMHETLALYVCLYLRIEWNVTTRWHIYFHGLFLGGFSASLAWSCRWMWWTECAEVSVVEVDTCVRRRTRVWQKLPTLSAINYFGIQSLEAQNIQYMCQSTVWFVFVLAFFRDSWF